VADPCTPIDVSGHDGTRLRACAHGGHVLGWRPGGGTDRLWVSSATGCRPGVAIRGGVPVIFPQFSSTGPLPKHGFARDRAWQPVPVHAPGGLATCAFRLEDDADTREVWPHRFRLEVHAAASADALEVTLVVHHPADSSDPGGAAGAASWSFTAALHTYLRLSDAAGARLSGVPGLPPSGLGPFDLMLTGADDAIAVHDAVFGDLVLTAEGFGDRVVWNPGPDHGLPDAAPGAERRFVCVEPAVLAATPLAPGESWRGSMRLTLM
jgi:glucose-6-phosphate 1-epimerase